ncbi:hypothetical protein BJY59DRAFT_441496 [Rhodotorula toruloides]
MQTPSRSDFSHSTVCTPVATPPPPCPAPNPSLARCGASCCLCTLDRTVQSTRAPQARVSANRIRVRSPRSASSSHISRSSTTARRKTACRPDTSKTVLQTNGRTGEPHADCARRIHPPCPDPRSLTSRRVSRSLAVVDRCTSTDPPSQPQACHLSRQHSLFPTERKLVFLLTQTLHDQSDTPQFQPVTT